MNPEPFVEVLGVEFELSFTASEGILWPRDAMASQFVEELGAESELSVTASKGML